MSTTTGSTSSSSSTATTPTTVDGVSRYYGLASGLDVDSIVKGLMTNDQNKIDKQKQTQQLLEWKQDAYRSITTELRTFQSTYLDLVGGSSSILSGSTFASYTGTSTNSAYLSVSGNADASAGTHSINIYQSARTASVTGKHISSAITGTADAAAADLAGTSFDITVDNVTKTIAFNEGETFSQDLLNQKLAAAFGTDSNNVCKVAATVDGSGHVSIDENGGYQAAVTVTGAETNDALVLLGIASGASNRIDTGSTDTLSGQSLYQLFGPQLTGVSSTGSFNVTINGTDVTLYANENLTQTFNRINASKAGVTASYDSTSDTIRLTSATGGAAGNITLSDSSGFFNAALGTDAERTAVTGKDAIISVDGTKITRSSNNFTVSGITYSILQDVPDSAVTSPITSQINLTNNTDDAVSSIKKFVDAYNKLITDINSQISEKPAETADHSKYAPLTDAQKASMSDDDITKWNEKAKSGILFGDDTLNQIVDAMRNMLDTPVVTSTGKSISLSDIGITTGTYDEKGQLHIDETKLKDALLNNTKAVTELFTKTSEIAYSSPSSTTDADQQSQRMKEEGLGYRLQDIVNNASGYSGSIVKLAGMPNESSETKNSIYDQLKTVNDTLSSLQTLFDSDRTRYYNEFSKLETYMEQMNSQSSSLSSMLSSS